MDPLANLPDIHLPPAVSIWPPAPGWWLLTALVIGCLVFSIRIVWKRWQRQQAKRCALRELAQLNERWQTQQETLTLLSDLSILVRRVALHYFPQTNVASLQQDEWLRFLDQTGQTDLFTKGAGRLLATGPYQKTPVVDWEPLFCVIKHWIKNVGQKKGMCKNKEIGLI